MGDPIFFFKHYFLAKGWIMEYKMLGGWQNTAQFGHEVELFTAFGGGY
jgi:hypothetical protein